MAHGFGQLAKITGIVYYKLSPFEQKAFAGAYSHGVPNMFRRFMSNVFRISPAFIIGYFIFTTTDAYHETLTRKNPEDFANDE